MARSFSGQLQDAIRQRLSAPAGDGAVNLVRVEFDLVLDEYLITAQWGPNDRVYATIDGEEIVALSGDANLVGIMADRVALRLRQYASASKKRALRGGDGCESRLHDVPAKRPALTFYCQGEED